MNVKKILALALSAAMMLSLSACVNQHPGEEEPQEEPTEDARLIATSPAVAQICSRLHLPLVGICDTISSVPEEYDGVTKVGMAMNPDLEIVKSLDPDYILSPATLQSDLQPKYAGIKEAAIFLDLTVI